MALTILDATTAAACAAATSQQAWCEALVAAWSGGNVTARLFATDGTTLRRTLTLGPFTIDTNTPRRVVCTAHLADTAVSTGAPGLWVFRSGSTDIFSLDAGTGAASINHVGNIKALCTPTLAGVTISADGDLAANFVPSWRASQTANTWVEVPVAAALSTLSPHLDASINPNYPGNPEYMSAGAGSWATRVTAWNGGCYDKGRDEFLMPLDGGHADYAGNDYVALRLRLDAPQWVRRSNPTGWDGSTLTNDQARLVSGSGTTCVLASGSNAPLIYPSGRDEASAVDDFYNGMSLFAFAQAEQTITDYVGSTRTATVSPGFSGDVTGRLYSISDGPMVHGLNGEKSGRYPDGRARAIHTYNLPEFADLDDAPWIAVGGSGFSWTASQAVSTSLRVARTDGAHTFYTGPNSTITASPFGGACAYDPTRGTKGSIWYIGQGAGVMGRLDCNAGTWSQVGSFSVRGGQHTMCYLTGHDLLLMCNNSGAWAIFDPSDNSLTNLTVTGTPAGSNTAIGQAQLNYVTADDSVYWWDAPSGSTTVINKMTVPASPKTDSWSITQTTPHASNTVTPSAATANGTFGRFRYSSFLDGFVLFNSVDGPVYFYARANL